MSKQIMSLKEIEKAVVSLPVKNGRGVLIPGEMILTASHCISCSCSGRMTLYEENPVKVNIKGKIVKLNILFVDPICDIAVLGALYDDTYPNEFSEFCEQIQPVKISNASYLPYEPIPLMIYNRNKHWVNASGEVTSTDSHKIWFNTDIEVAPGASGGAIVNGNHELVSIISNCNSYSRDISGWSPLPMLTLPKWILSRMKVNR